MRPRNRVAPALLSLALPSLVVPAHAQQKPNVVFILGGQYRLRRSGALWAASCAEHQRRASTSSPMRGCVHAIPGRARLHAIARGLDDGQYSIRNGLSLILVSGSPNTLPARAFTMGELFKNVGYSTAIFGKWHLGIDPESLPTAHGFDEFYGIPPDLLGFGNIRRHDRAHALDECAARRAAGQGTADLRGRGRRAVAQGQAVHTGSPG